MGAWIMSVVGVICLGILLEIVLPEGQTAKYVKGAFSLLVVFVIAAPLPTFLNKDYKFSISDSAIEIDEEYINSTYAVYTEGVKDRAQYTLKSSGYDTGVEVELSEGMPLKIKQIRVSVYNFKQEVIKSVSADIKGILSDNLRCSEDVIEVVLKSGADK